METVSAVGMEQRRITLYEGQGPGEPALARFDLDMPKDEQLPEAFRWNGDVFTAQIIEGEMTGAYMLCVPVEIGIPTKPKDPCARRVLMLAPVESRPTW